MFFIKKSMYEYKSTIDVHWIALELKRSYLKPVMTPVAWVAGKWLTALDIHLSNTAEKSEHKAKNKKKKVKMVQF